MVWRSPGTLDLKIDGALEGVGKRKNSQTLARSGRPESSGIWQELAPVVSQRFQESFERHWDRFGAFPNISRSSWRPLGEVRRRWIDKNSGLRAARSRWIDKNSSFSGPWDATGASNAHSNCYPEPPKHTIFYMILNS